MGFDWGFNSQLSGKGLVQQQLLQRLERGQLAGVEAGKSLGFFVEVGQDGNDGLLFLDPSWKAHDDFADLRWRGVAHLHARGAGVNGLSHSLRVEDVEEELIDPWDTGLNRNKTEPIPKPLEGLKIGGGKRVR